MIVSRKSFALLVLAGLASVASATDVTAIDGTQGWTLNGTSGGGSAFVGGSSADGNGALQINGDRARVAFGYGDNGGSPVNFGTLGQLAAGSMSVDLFRDVSSTSTDGRYNVAVKVFLSNGMSLTWENAYNNQFNDEGVWHTGVSIGGNDGKFWLRDPGTKTSYIDGGQWYTLSTYVNGGLTLNGQGNNGAGPATSLSPTNFGDLTVIGLSFAVGSGVPGGTFVGAADNLKVNFGNGGASYNYNFQDPNFVSPTVPAPAAMSAFALGLAGRLRRRKRA